MRAKAEEEENQVRHHKVRGPPTVSAPRQCQESVNGSASELAESFRLGTFLILSFRQCHSTSVQHHLRVWTGPVTCECNVRSVTLSCKDTSGSGHHQALVPWHDICTRLMSTAACSGTCPELEPRAVVHAFGQASAVRHQQDCKHIAFIIG